MLRYRTHSTLSLGRSALNHISQPVRPGQQIAAISFLRPPLVIMLDVGFTSDRAVATTGLQLLLAF
jgi:hypothetical protein